MSENNIDTNVVDTTVDEKVDTAVDEKKEEVTVVDEQPKIDIEEITAKAAEKIIEKLSPKVEKVDPRDLELTSPWSREGRNPKDYDEIADWATEKKSILDKREREESAKKNEELTKSERERIERVGKEWDARWNKEFEDLAKSGKIPAIVDENDENDAGKVARREIFKHAYDAVQKGEMDKESPSMKIAYYEYYQNKPRSVAGANAPIGAGKRNSTPSNNQEIDYHKLHNASLSDIIRGKV